MRNERQQQPPRPVVRWLASALSGTESIGFAWVSLLAFVRLSTNPRVFAAPLTVSTAFHLIDSWLGQPPSMIAMPTSRHSIILRGLLEQAGSAGNLTTDGRLAALTVGHSAEIVTFDSNFRRFSVRVHVPG